LNSDSKKTQGSITAQKAESATLSTQANDLQVQLSAAQQNEALFNITLGNLKSNLDKTDRDVREVVNDVPKGLNLSNIEYQSDSITATGVASTQALVLTYARSLRTGGRFKSVIVSSVQTLSDGTFGFTIILR
jgi:Tfp pilus assembly protein PilN